MAWSSKEINYNHNRVNSGKSKNLSDVENQAEDQNSGSVFSKMTNADSNNATTQCKSN